MTDMTEVDGCAVRNPVTGKWHVKIEWQEGTEKRLIVSSESFDTPDKALSELTEWVVANGGEFHRMN